MVVPGLSPAEVEQYRGQGYLVTGDGLFPRSDLEALKSRVDELYRRWRTLPRYLAPGSRLAQEPAIRQIHRITAFDRAIAGSPVIETCRRLAAQLLGHRVFCHYDTAIFKFPGAGPVAWHQDFAESRTMLLHNAVHFWLPLESFPPDAGALVYVPGSHARELHHHPLAGTSYVVKHEADDVVGNDERVVVVPVGGAAIHTPMTLHCSEPNRSDEVRRAVVLQFGTGAWAAARRYGRFVQRFEAAVGY